MDITNCSKVTLQKTASSRRIFGNGQKKLSNIWHSLPQELADRIFDIGITDVEPRVVPVCIYYDLANYQTMIPTSRYPNAFNINPRLWNLAFKIYLYKEKRLSPANMPAPTWRPLLLNPQSDILWLTNFSHYCLYAGPSLAQPNIFWDGPAVKRLAIPFSSFVSFSTPHIMPTWMGQLHQKGVQRLYLVIGTENALRKDSVFCHPPGKPANFFHQYSPLGIWIERLLKTEGLQNNWQTLERAILENSRRCMANAIRLCNTMLLGLDPNDPDAEPSIEFLDPTLPNTRVFEDVKIQTDPNSAYNWINHFMTKYCFHPDADKPDSSLREIDIIVCRAICKKIYDVNPKSYTRVDVDYEWESSTDTTIKDGEGTSLIWELVSGRGCEEWVSLEEILEGR